MLPRQAVPADAGAIRGLTRAAYAKWVPRIGREPMPMQADYDRALREHRFDLLFVDEALAALIQTIPGEDHLLVENLAVAPAFQGRGFARRLMAHAEDLAASRGHREMRLYTNKLFAENIALYLRLGYRVTREEPFLAGVTVHMAKALSIAPPGDPHV